MGQYFQLVAPRARLALSWHGKLGEVLFDGSPSQLVPLLVVPVRPQHNQSQNVPVGSSNTVCPKKRKVEHMSKGCNLSSLPPELHRLIFSFIKDLVDVVSFSITNQHFLFIGRDFLHDYYMSHFGRWAGTNVVCVGDYVKPGDYPPGLFSADEIEALRHQTTKIFDDGEYSDQGEFPHSPLTLWHFTHPVMSRIQHNTESLFWLGLSLSGRCALRNIESDPAFSYIKPQVRVKNETYFPADQEWILRNLTTKQFVRSHAIALSPEYIDGPYIDVLGFGHVVMSRTCWSSDSSVSMHDPTNISRGVWAGHCFDITTLSRHAAETCGETWSDVSDEIAREIAVIWEAEEGPDWRAIICKDRHG